MPISNETKRAVMQRIFGINAEIKSLQDQKPMWQNRKDEAVSHLQKLNSEIDKLQAEKAAIQADVDS